MEGIILFGHFEEKESAEELDSWVTRRLGVMGIMSFMFPMDGIIFFGPAIYRGLDSSVLSIESRKLRSVMSSLGIVLSMNRCRVSAFSRFPRSFILLNRSFTSDTD